MTGRLIINGKDAWTTWGVFLEEGSYGRLLSGDSVKPYTTNESRSIDGVDVWIKDPRLEARRLTVVVCFAERSGSFVGRYNSLISELLQGRMQGNRRIPNSFNVPPIGKNFKFIYEGHTNLTQSNMAIGKVALRFFEPNPADR